MNTKKYQFGFTLTELLVVLSIIALLFSILIPALRTVRLKSYQLICGLNIAGVARGLFVYSQTYDDKLPAAYNYLSKDNVSSASRTSEVSSGISGDTPLISHWSFILQNRGMIINKQVTCPMFRKGGLPPRSTCENNLEEGQISLVTDAVDRQVPRCAYTVNEALCPRNRFTSGFEDAIRLSRYVDISEVRNISRTILVAEWTTNWELLAAPGDGICRSYLPVHGAKALGTSDHYNLNSVPVCPGKPCYRGGIYEKLTASDLSRWQSPARYSPSRLDWVGRNHGRCSASSPKDLRKSNFTYMDGHVECKSVYKTINPESYEWAERVYSIDCGNNHIK